MLDIFDGKDTKAHDELYGYVDKHISCKIPDEYDDDENWRELQDLVWLQKHKHRKNGCFKHRRTECRFSFPKPPMPFTMLMKPPIYNNDSNGGEENDGIDKEELQKRKSRWKRIVNKLEDEKFFNQGHIDSYNSDYQKYIQTVIFAPDYVKELKDELDKSHGNFVFTNDDKKLTKEAFMFARFLKKDLDNMTFQEYLEAVSTNVVRDVIQLKRKPWESRINNYNPYLLRAWRANCDLQYILDPVSYTHLTLPTKA